MPAAMPVMEIIDLLMRGGVVAVSALVIVQLLAIRPLRAGAVFGSLFLFVAVAYVINSIPGGEVFLGAAYLPTKAMGFAAPNVFLMFALALSRDDYRPTWLDGALLAANMVLFYIVCVPQASTMTVIGRLAHVAMSIALVAAAMRVTWKCLADDLVESRREVSKAMLYIMPFAGFIILLFTLLETWNWPARPEPLLQSSMVLLTVAAFAYAISATKDGIFASPEPATQPVAGEISPADRIDMRRLQELMAKNIYLEPNLTIGTLAARMGVPEHRLRKLINNHMGYRNFAAFINDHRIDEAKRRLGSAALAREQITGLAYDLGFASLAPFNRAFKERVGMSPSEFRTKSLTSLLETTENRLPS
jgi:AraC-like DNA-binding protein